MWFWCASSHHTTGMGFCHSFSPSVSVHICEAGCPDASSLTVLPQLRILPLGWDCHRHCLPQPLHQHPGQCGLHPVSVHGSAQLHVSLGFFVCLWILYTCICLETFTFNALNNCIDTMCLSLSQTCISDYHAVPLSGQLSVEGLEIPGTDGLKSVLSPDNPTSFAHMVSSMCVC